MAKYNYFKCVLWGEAALRFENSRVTGITKNKALRYFCKVCNKNQDQAKNFIARIVAKPNDMPTKKEIQVFRVPTTPKTLQFVEFAIKLYGFAGFEQYLLQFLATPAKKRQIKRK